MCHPGPDCFIQSLVLIPGITTLQVYSKCAHPYIKWANGGLKKSCVKMVVWFVLFYKQSDEHLAVLNTKH